MGLFVGHLPLARLPSGQAEMMVSPGVLRSLSFDEWTKIDRSFTTKLSVYERTAPVFFELEVPEFGVGVAALHTFYRALLLVTAARFPQPELSVSYLVHDGGRYVERRVGPCEREMILFGDQHPLVEFDADDADEITRVQDLLTAHGEEVLPVMEALVRTTHPGFTHLNETLHLVGGLEALLVRFGEPLTATFARRYSVLAADGDPREYEPLGRELYGLRSDLIHGRQLKQVHTAERDEFLARQHRPLTCELTVRALSWFTGNAGRSFHEALDAAFEEGRS